MSGNLTPWIVLGMIVVATLAWKGHLRLPSFGKSGSSAPVASMVAAARGQSVEALSKLDSKTLVSALAIAKRREMDIDAADAMAQAIGKTVEDAMRGPFPVGGATPKPSQ